MKDVLDRFNENLSDVDRLVNFDKEVLQIVIINLRELHETLRKSIPDERRNGGRVLQMVEGIRNNDSLKSKYSAIFNQALVLLVAHFSTALGDLFRQAVNQQLDLSSDSNFLSEEVKITFSEMKDRDWNLKEAAADILIAKHDFTFQDMASTVRAFEKYVGVQVVRGEAMNNIIAAQACRHVIAHAGGLVGQRAVRQVSSARPRTLRPIITDGEQISFSIEELELVKKSMLKLLKELIEGINKG